MTKERSAEWRPTACIEDRDPLVGTPWHEHVPARVERLARTIPTP